ncbi:hypothetical protein [Nonlabens dokdonensis]|uniref:hypothetical protein n=1 Tax=Nonlabens dokdonensis TaxID=328515 RepID=UPI0026EDBBE3|nr:hypothetical protein [Nonlabens dokdonensis]
MSEKIYIAKGRKPENLNLINITLDLDELLEHAYNHKGKDKVKITVAKMQKPDKYKNTHTVYINNYVKPKEEK